MSTQLTPMQSRVADLLASGLTRREVSEELGLSIRTVEAHIAFAKGYGSRQLTPRQSEIAELVRGGLSNREIASELGITYQTVKITLKAVFSKYGVQSRADLLWELNGGKPKMLSPIMRLERVALECARAIREIEEETDLSKGIEHKSAALRELGLSCGHLNVAIDHLKQIGIDRADPETEAA